MLALPWGEGKNEARRGRWEKREEARLSPFDYRYFIGIPSGSFCRGESERDQMVVSRHRKIDVKLLNKTTEDAQDNHAVVFNT